MKRFTDTEKWSDPWFRRLTSPAKQLWGYATDRCDKTGLVELDLELVTLDVGQLVGSEHISELSSRIEDCGGGKFFLPKFINFQYGLLTDSCPPHRSIIELVKKHGLIKDGLLYHYPNATLAIGLKTRQEEDKTRQEMVKVGDRTSTTQSDEDWIKGLEANIAYQGINIRVEFGKMVAWCGVQRKQPSRRRFINWLNRVDRPMNGLSRPTPLKSTPAPALKGIEQNPETLKRMAAMTAEQRSKL